MYKALEKEWDFEPNSHISRRGVQPFRDSKQCNMIHQFYLYAYHLGLRLTLRRGSDIQAWVQHLAVHLAPKRGSGIQTWVQHLAVHLAPKRGSGIQAWVQHLAVHLAPKRGFGIQAYVWHLNVIWHLDIHLAIGVPLIGVHLTGYTFYRQPSHRRVSPISHFIGVPLVNVINVISVYLPLIDGYLLQTILQTYLLQACILQASQTWLTCRRVSHRRVSYRRYRRGQRVSYRRLPQTPSIEIGIDISIGIDGVSPFQRHTGIIPVQRVFLPSLVLAIAWSATDQL